MQIRGGNEHPFAHGTPLPLVKVIRFRHDPSVPDFALKRPVHSPFRRYWAFSPALVFLNHGSFGACPRPVLKIQQELRREMESSPVQFLWRRFEDRLEPSRVELARFVGARPRDIVFVANATTGVNAVLRSLRFRRGDELLTTSLIYNACRNVLIEVARVHGARLVIADVPFPLNAKSEIMEAVLAKVTRRTKLAMLDHVTSDTGMILPIQDLVRELSTRGIETLVDGAHAPGMLPINLAKLGAAYYAANLHKWVCAPKGAAFLWVREDKQAEIQPSVISHGNNRSRPGYTSFQDRFDWPATFDPTAWFSVKGALQWMRGLLPGGWRALQAHNHRLVVDARKLLCARLGVGLRAGLDARLVGNHSASRQFSRSAQSREDRCRTSGALRPVLDRSAFQSFWSSSAAWFRISSQIYNSMAE
jgi:isopenicillin-N epimerase